MTDYTKIKFEFPLQLAEKKEKEGKFIFEGFAAGNDFDLQNDIISDEALKKSIDDFKKQGKFCINHTEEEIGKLLDCRFEKGKIWVRTEVTNKSIIEKVKSGELNCLSIKGQVMKAEKVELLPDLRLMLIKEMHLIEVSLVPQGANPEAKAIRWYVSKAINAEADKNMQNKEKIEEIDLSEDDSGFVAVSEDEDSVDVTEEEVTKDEVVEETPTEETKIDEALVEETPVEEAPVEEPKKELSEKVVYSVVNSSAIELTDRKDFSEFDKELLRVGKWQHCASRTGVLDVTKEMLKSIVKNFKDKVLDNVFVPLGHPTTDDPSKNVGEVVGLELSKDESKLMAKIDVKETSVSDKIRNGLIKGISASFTENYTQKDTGKDIGPTLFHAALVSEPYIKKMEGFVPLSDSLEGSKVISLENMDKPLTIAQLSERVRELEAKLDLNENEDASEEASDESTEDAPSKEEVTEEKPTTEEPTTEETKEETESSAVGEQAKEEEEVKTEEPKVEEPKVEETKPEEKTEEVKVEVDEGVALAEAEKVFGELLIQGRVTPAEKELLLPLLRSNTPVELADGNKVDIRKALKKYLDSRSPVFSLEEFGTIEGDKLNGDEVPEEVSEQLDNMGFSEDVHKEVYIDFKKTKENGGKTEEIESTLF